MALLSANPAQKGTAEKVAEWIPITGTIITGKDAYLYFKDGRYVAGGIMTTATVVSGVGDVLLFTGIGAPGKAGAVVADKALTEAAKRVAKKAATLTAEKTLQTAEDVAAKSAINEIVKTGGEVTKETAGAITNKAVDRVAKLPSVEAYELLSKAEAARIAENTALIAEKVGKRIKYLLGRPDTAAKLETMAVSEQKAFVEKLATAEWKKLTGKEAMLAAEKEAAEKTASEAVKATAKATTSKVKKAGTKISEFADKESRAVGAFKKGRELAGTKETALEKALVWGGHVPATIPYGIMDIGGGLVKGTIWLGKTGLEKTGQRTVPFVSGLTGREGIGWVAVKVGQKEPKSTDKKAEAPKPAAAVSTGVTATAETQKLTSDEQKYKELRGQIYSNIDKLGYSNPGEYKAFLDEQIKGETTEKGKFEKLTATLNAHVEQKILTETDKKKILDVK